MLERVSNTTPKLVWKTICNILLHNGFSKVGILSSSDQKKHINDPLKICEEIVETFVNIGINVLCRILSNKFSKKAKRMKLITSTQ